MSDEASSQSTTSHCNKCGADTNHNIRGKYEKRWAEKIDNEFDVNGGNEYFILECAGCGEVSMRKDSWCSEDYDVGPGGYELNVVKAYYPPRTFRKKPDWLDDSVFQKNCPETIRELFDEAYIGMQNKCARSTVMTIRAILEEIMIRAVEDRGTFKDNMTAFESAGHIAAKDREVLAAVIESGNAAIHRRFKPSGDDLLLCFDITERIAQRIYLHDAQVKSLKRRIPKKKKPRKTKPVSPP